MTAAALQRQPVWELLSTEWTDSDRVDLSFVDEASDDGDEAIVSVWIKPHDGYREEIFVVDVEGAPIDNAELRVEAHRRRLVDEFWQQQKRWRC